VHDLLSIYRALELIETRLRDDVIASEMAMAAGYSLYHFIRTFDRVVHHTPYNYLMRRRLSEAAYELAHSHRRVIDIALDYRFGNHETFSRAFKRLFGVQPTQWRELGAIPHQGLMPPLSFAYLEHIHKPGFQKPKLAEFPSRWVAGLMTQMVGQPGEVEQLWRSLGRTLEMQPPAQDPASFFGVISYLEGLSGKGFYMAAVEMLSSDMDAPHLVYRSLPAGQYICMAHNGSVETLSLTLTYLYHTWLPKAGLQPACPLEILAFGEAPPWRGENSSEITILAPVK